MLLLRIEMDDRPGALGQIATAMGGVGADIDAIEIVQRFEGSVIDDFIVELPGDVMPDTLVSQCHEVPGVRVLWLSRFAEAWSLRDVADAIDQMLDDPAQAAERLTHDAPSTCHVQWATLVHPDPFAQLISSERAPEIGEDLFGRLGAFDRPRSVELTDDDLPGWGDTIVAFSPLRDGRVLLVGRRGGPSFLPSELRRLRHLTALV